MTIKAALEIAKSRHKGERKALECEILLAFILKKSRIFLHSHSDFEIPNEAFDALLREVERLNENYPIEYITKEVSFFSQYFFIDEGALIPRPETELLVQKASLVIEKYKIKKAFEIGVGSGVVSIMLCLLHKDLEMISSDISPSALKIARQNIALKSALDSTLKDRISLVKTNLLENIKRGKNDFIISNPPYISEDYKIPPNLAFEPKEALFGGKNGDEILRQIIALEPKYLACEIGYNQADIAQYLTKYDAEFYRDYGGFVRGFSAVRL